MPYNERGSFYFFLCFELGGVMREGEYQAYLIKEIKLLLPGCMVLKNDSGYIQGIPDLTVLFHERWGVLEVKIKRPTKASDFEPNQEWYLEHMDELSFAACIYPENEDEVLGDLQYALSAGRKTRVS
jgi:hypothetical protein